MSEPTIKPRCWVCEDCGTTWSIGERFGEFCCSPHAKIGHGYTHDDLVAVVREAQECVWVKSGYDEGPTAVFDESPEHIVERLTGVKR